MSKMDQWEKEALAYAKFHITFTCSEDELKMKDAFTKFSASYVKSLIELVRKKDAAFKAMIGETKYRDGWSEERKLSQSEMVIKSISNLSEKSLALTDQLEGSGE